MVEPVEESSSTDPRAMTTSSGVGHGSSMHPARYTPGSAIIYKGEPTATELSMLRFKLTHDDRKRLNDIVTVVMDGYKELEELDEKVKKERFDAVVKRMEQEDLAAPLRVDHSAPDSCYSIAATFSSMPENAPKFVLLWRLLRRLDPRRAKGDKSQP
ncbi:MAG: hypothetical protein ACRDTC_04830 [Pseudonocardiaceae bacterium]